MCAARSPVRSATAPVLFEDAHGGTLFLDEVVDLSARAQAKLLRVLQQQEVRRLGESRTRRIDVRIVSAANRDPRRGRRGRRLSAGPGLPARRDSHLACRRSASGART